MPRNSTYLRCMVIAFSTFLFPNLTWANCGFSIEAILYTEPACGAATGRARVILSPGALAPLNFAWSNGQNTAEAIGLSAGVYQVTVTDANLCQAVARVELQNPGSAQINSLTTSPATCQSLNGQIDLNLSGAAPYTVDWTGPSSGSLNNQGANISLTGLEAGDYELRLLDAQGCERYTRATVGRSGGITMTSSTIQAPTCGGGTNGTLRGSATLGSLPFEFRLNGVSVGTFFNSNFDFTNLSAGVYEIEIIDANGCRVSQQAILNEQGSTPLNAADFGSQNAACPSAPNARLFELAPSAIPYQVFNLATGALVGPLPQNNLTAGRYQIRLSNAGCVSFLEYNLTEPERWRLSVETGNANCTAGQGFINLTVAGASPGYTYAWSNGGNTQDLSGLFPAPYTVTVTDASACPLVFPNIRVENCSSRDTVRVLTGGSFNYCADTLDVFGNVGTVIDLCPGSINNGTASALGIDGCFNYTAGAQLGIDSICIQVCNVAADFCDTTTVVILVQAPVDTVRGTLSVNSSLTLCPDNSALPGTVVSATDLNCRALSFGSIGSINAADGCITYNAAGVVGRDTICLLVCDNQGFCDTSIFVYTVISPIDTVNVNVNANTTGTYCPPLGIFPGTVQTVTDLSCSVLTNGNLAGIDFTTGCVSYAAGASIGRDTICVEICDNQGNCDTTVIAWNIVPRPDTALIDVPAGSGAQDSCLFGFQFPQGNITSIVDLNCSGNLFGSYTLDVATGCVNYSPPSSLPNSGVRADTICVQFCDNSTPAYCDTAVFVFRNLQPNCSPPVVPAQLSAQGAQCSDLGVCLPIPLDSFPFYNLSINGAAYNGPVAGCDLIRRIQYPLVLIPGCTNDFILNWQIDGTSFGPVQVSGLVGIINQMNTWDNNTTWQLDNNNALGINLGNDNLVYGTLSVQCVGGGAPTQLGATNQNNFARGTSIRFSNPGTYTLFTQGPLGCIDTTNLIVLCAASSEVRDTIFINGNGSNCQIDRSQVPTVHTISNACPLSPSIVDFTIDPSNNGCISYQSNGSGVGETRACIIVCDTTGAGVCDTTYVLITVVFAPPAAARDSVALPYLASSINFDVCPNDSFSRLDFDIRIVTPPSRGTVIGQDCEWSYSPSNPNICGRDSLEYELTNPAGTSRAWVYFELPCRPFSISEGISPNGDGINDFFIVNSLQDYPDHEVFIFNRWGNVVLRAKNYQNDWQGTFNGRDLPDGAYFYIIYLNNSRGEVFQGPLVIQR